MSFSAPSQGTSPSPDPALWLAGTQGPPPGSDAGAAPGRAAAIDRSKVTLLVVDDTAASRYALARGLRQLGFQVVEAATGEEALRLAPGCSAVLLDVRLPDILGTDVCRRLREGPSTGAIPIVHVSSLAPSEHGPDIGDFSGADAYLLSPVDVVFVASLIEDLLRERSRMS